MTQNSSDIPRARVRGLSAPMAVLPNVLFAVVIALTAGVIGVMGCAGGAPSIPEAPDQILTKGDSHYQKRKWYQAQELYRGFLQRHPGHDRSDYAQFMLAESYFADEEYGLAAVEYRILVTNYGYSEYVDDAYLKEAVSLFEQAPDYAKDQTKTYEALDKLNQFVRVFGSSPLLPKAVDYVERIQSKLARKELDNAMFYIKTKRRASAIIYLDKIIEDYPNNEYWARALYHKAKLLYDGGEDLEEAARLLSQVVAYPQDVDIKPAAEELLRALRKEMNRG